METSLYFNPIYVPKNMTVVFKVLEISSVVAFLHLPLMKYGMRSEVEVALSVWRWGVRRTKAVLG